MRALLAAVSLVAQSITGGPAISVHHVTPHVKPTPVQLVPNQNPHSRVELSENWSGYAILGKFNYVQGTFIVPKLVNNNGGDVSAWVGVDGWNNNDLIQAGVEITGGYGGESVQAWWEILPSAETPVQWMTVNPGDMIRISIRHEPEDLSAGSGPWAWDISILDLTNYQEFSQQFNYNGPATSVEWIEEAPEVFGGIANVLGVQPVYFSDLVADGKSSHVEDVWLSQNGAVQNVPSSVTSARELMSQGFTDEYVG